MKTSMRKNFQALSDMAIVAVRQINTLADRFQPGDYRITIERLDQQRTTEQNRFYWAMLQEIAEETGNSPEVLHDSFRTMFLIDWSTVPPRVRSTTELDVRQFISYLDMILAYLGSEMGITVRQKREF